jgi:hypothetical protein
MDYFKFKHNRLLCFVYSLMLDVKFNFREDVNGELFARGLFYQPNVFQRLYIINKFIVNINIRAS